MSPLIDTEAIFVEGGRRIQAAWPEVWRDRDSLSEKEERELEIRLAALRFLLGQETRSMRAVSESLGVSVALLSYYFKTLSQRLGFQKFLKSRGAREAFSESARRRWAERKKPPTGATPMAAKKTEEHAKALR
jgi:hypothetical protein